MVQIPVPLVYFMCIYNPIKTLKKVLMFNAARLLETSHYVVYKSDSAPNGFVLHIF